MAVTNFSPLLGLALPTTGDLQGTWGNTVNNAITNLLDSAVAGTTTLSADSPVDKTTWATYRQALRDLPKETGFPWDMIWPTEP
jgi:hypothetical protein